MTFGDRLRTARIARGYTQADVAQLLDVHVSTAGSWERENRRPHYDQVARLSQIYGVSTDYLLHGSDDPGEGDQLVEMLKAAGATDRDIQTILALLETRKKAILLEQRIQTDREDDTE